MLKHHSIKDYDFKVVIMIIAITVIGILAIGSAKEAYQEKQIMGFVFGLFLMILISLFDYSVFLRFYWVLYFLNIALLVLVQLIGDKSGGAQRWVEIAGIRFQPSETAKILLILFYAQFIMRYKDKLNNFKTLLLLIITLIVPLILIYQQPDLSTSIMIIIIFCAMLFIGGLSYKIVVGVLAVGIPAAVIFLSIVLQDGQNLIKEYQRTRILAWLQPEKYANAEGYQQANAKMAIGSGQLWGKGLNNNVIASVKNGNFISEPQTDFIFAVIGEELGFIGACAVILLLLLITLECILIAKRANDMAGTLICTGMATLIGGQGFMNISVATGLIPNTGIPLPFVSYGLTSLVSLYIGMGFVLNVRWQSKKY